MGGQDTASDRTERRYQLVGEVAGHRRTFPLGMGEHTVGSTPGEERHLVLPVRGVSRRHGVITPGADGVTVADLESKNGTFINDRRVRQGSVAVGDTVRFGPVALRLEVVAAEDVDLGLELSGGAISWSGLGGLEHTPRLSGLPEIGELGGATGGTVGADLRLVSALLERLTLRPAADLEGALTLLVTALGAVCGALAEYAPGQPPVVLATSGTVSPPPLPTLRVLRGNGGEAAPGLPPLRFATGEGAEGGLVALLVWGGVQSLQSLQSLQSPQSPPDLLLSTALALLRAFLPPALAPTEAIGPRSRSAHTLVFPDGIVPGEAPAMVAFYRQMEQLLVGEFPVLLLGETGVGKEHLARVLHGSSPRRRGPFVAVNCAAIPAELLEAEMFGVVRGAATGVEARQGKFVEANDGVLFLDEVGEMSIDLQAKLLRALQEGEVQPVGGRPVRVAVRVVAATNADLLARAGEGRFRADLYYRLAGYVLAVPPLRRRREDLPRLLGHFVRRFSTELEKPVRGVTVKALRLLTAYPWPGNVRELEHAIRRQVVLCPRGGAIDSSQLPAEIVQGAMDAQEPEDPAPDAGLEPRLEALEGRLIRRALVTTGGNQTRAAKILRISRNGLAKRLKRLGISPDELIPH